MAMTKTLSVRRKKFLARAFFFQANRFGWAEFGGEQNFFVTVSLGIDNFGNHFGIELEYFRRDLNTLGVTLALGSVHGDFHFLSNVEFGFGDAKRCG